MATCCSGLALVRCSLVSTASKILKTLVPRPLMVVFPVPSAQMTMFFGTSVGEREPGSQIEQRLIEEELVEHRSDRQLAEWHRHDRLPMARALAHAMSYIVVRRHGQSTGGETRQAARREGEDFGGGVNRWLIRFDVRADKDHYVRARWDANARTRYLLRPDVTWPLSVDRRVCPSV